MGVYLDHRQIIWSQSRRSVDCYQRLARYRIDQFRNDREGVDSRDRKQIYRDSSVQWIKIVIGQALKLE